MKSIVKNIALLVAAVALVCCSSDNEEIKVEFANGMSTTNTDVSTTLSVNKVVTFMDLSRMVESREWILDEGMEFSEGDATSQMISVKFLEEGYDKSVSLKVVLSQPDLDIVAKNEAYVESGELDLVVDPQIYTETYSYLVLNAITINMLAMPLGDGGSGGIDTPDYFDEPDFNYSNCKVKIPVGGSVQLEAYCTGMPTSYTWTLPGANVETVSGNASEGYGTVTPTYSTAGTYDVKIEAVRTTPSSTVNRTFTGYIVVE